MGMFFREANGKLQKLLPMVKMADKTCDVDPNTLTMMLLEIRALDRVVFDGNSKLLVIDDNA